jgi:glycosyltransferase involved in cell wall biosynthesis
MSGWTAGRSYSLGLALSLDRHGVETGFLTRSPPKHIRHDRVIALGPEHYFPGEWTLRNLFKAGRKNVLQASVRQHRFQAVGPILHPMQLCRGTRNIGWIPDFQPFILSDLYREDELEKIRVRTLSLLACSDTVIVSSEDSHNTLGELFPAYKNKARILSFPSNFAFLDIPSTTCGVVEKYHLPKKFVLVANQFWKHKNHLLVVKALGLLKRRGYPITCAMTGLPVDFRDTANAALSHLFQEIAAQDLLPECRVLGYVSGGEMQQLLRSATLLIQPSLFEGWNTTVQDAKALGCPLLVSDIPIHREQAPSAEAFFDPHDPESLANALEGQFALLPARPDREKEKLSLEREKSFASEHGARAAGIFLETS